jgi:hypothetical protein
MHERGMAQSALRQGIANGFNKATPFCNIAIRKY